MEDAQLLRRKLCVEGRCCQEAEGGHGLSDESGGLWAFASGKMSVACNFKMNSISTFITDFINRY